MADSRIDYYPLFYKYNRWGSNKQWIFRRMRVIPKSRQKEVSTKYSSLYLADPHGKGNDNANSYLDDLAKGYIK